MSRRRLERLLNLTMCLMATSRFLTVSQIGEMVDGYEPGESEEAREAFRRMFERDKQSLREIGIPVETGSDSAFSDELGYRIPRGDYALGEIPLDPDEFAALALAASLWSSEALAAPAASALRKLAAAGAPVRPAALRGPDPLAVSSGPAAGFDAADGLGGLGSTDGFAGFEPRVDATEPAFEAVLAAVQARREVRFPYRRPGQTEDTERHLQPWGVLSWRGRWYLVGHDLNRQASRVFRLSRVTGPVRAVGPAEAFTVPPEVDLRAMVSATEPTEPSRTALLWVRRGCGHALRRHGRPAGPARAAAAERVGRLPGGDLLEVEFSDLERFARWAVGYGPDVVVLEPADLRGEVVRRLRATVAATALPTPAASPVARAAAVGTGPR
ncbi:WYL domain-containing protein [Frankia sp. CcI49]|uniref:helix-turn-helix transcriptional regulator n=2 Tax=unclassified Frankia TaxID=2632575 RepID=UPI0006C9E931|nr:transcriptional regulator [Frankia sp. R43]ONH58242.1 WYL domain-containing protein [Frankia sp. CcI49]